MDSDPTLSEVVKKTKIGRTKRVLVILVALLVIAGLTGVVVVGFRGRHIARNAAALTAPASSPAKGGWRPWWLQ